MTGWSRAIVVAVAMFTSSAGLSRAGEQTTRPSSQPSARRAPVTSEVDQIVRRLGAATEACKQCGGTGRYQNEATRKWQDCGCGETHRSIRKGQYEAFLAAYADLVALPSAGKPSAAKKKPPAEELWRRAAPAMIRGGCGINSPPPLSFQRELTHMPEYDLPYTSEAVSAALGKQDPTGRLIAFTGEVVDARDDGQVPRILIAVESTRHALHIEAAPPAGIRWVRGARIFVIGRVARGGDPITVEALPGSE